MTFLSVRDTTELERYGFGERCNSHITQVKIVNHQHALSVNAPPLSQYPALPSRVVLELKLNGSIRRAGN